MSDTFCDGDSGSAQRHGRSRRRQSLHRGRTSSHFFLRALHDRQPARDREARGRRAWLDPGSLFLARVWGSQICPRPSGLARFSFLNQGHNVRAQREQGFPPSHRCFCLDQCLFSNLTGCTDNLCASSADLGGEFHDARSFVVSSWMIEQASREEGSEDARLISIRSDGADTRTLSVTSDAFPTPS